MLIECGVRVAVARDLMPQVHNTTDELRVLFCHLTHGEEGGLHTVPFQEGEVLFCHRRHAFGISFSSRHPETYIFKINTKQKHFKYCTSLDLVSTDKMHLPG